MSGVVVRFAQTAVADLEDLKAWYAEQGSPGVGARIVREIMESIETLAAYPEIGRIVPEFNQPALRELIRPPFRIVYRCNSMHVRIVRVWRSERLLVLTGAER